MTENTSKQPKREQRKPWDAAYREQIPRELHRLYNGRRRLKQRGLSDAAFIRLIDSQDWRCPICRCELVDGHFERRDGKTIAAPDTSEAKREWRPNAACIDHDHESGRVRGILCTCCNRALGLLRESEVIVLRASKYLQERAKTDHRDREVVEIRDWRDEFGAEIEKRREERLSKRREKRKGSP